MENKNLPYCCCWHHNQMLHTSRLGSSLLQGPLLWCTQPPSQWKKKQLFACVAITVQSANPSHGQAMAVANSSLLPCQMQLMPQQVQQTGHCEREKVLMSALQLSHWRYTWGVLFIEFEDNLLNIISLGQLDYLPAHEVPQWVALCF